MPIKMKEKFQHRFTDNGELPKPFPPAWACAWGQDQYGLWAAFELSGVTQTMRWIQPGEFGMGSQEGEDSKQINERLHRVTLTRGYWLADTACTQELWTAVMGQNPSRFTNSEQFPVENVTWDDCEAFLVTIKLKYGFTLRLPTEAQWEYACRAGTSSPFSFGGTITTYQVNYNGQYPYKDTQKTEPRGKTVPVKELPCNQWGLYQMHGNVWEWCYDWYGEYPENEVTDPTGPETGESRVLRGGSWCIIARICRSAFRLRYRPVIRIHYFGFRFSRGHQ